MRAFAVALTILTAAGVAEARDMTLEEAMRDPNVDVRITSPGGYAGVRVSARNRGGEDVRIVGSVGDVLENQNPSEQDLIFGEGMQLRVGPGETAASTVGTYCINPDRSSPSSGASFVPRPNDQGLAMFVRRSGGGGPGGFRGELQGAVWEHIRRNPTPVPQLPPIELRLVEPSPVQLRVIEGAVPFTGEAPAASPPPEVQLEAIQIQPENPPEQIQEPVPQPRPRPRPRAPRPRNPASPDPQNPIILIPD